MRSCLARYGGPHGYSEHTTPGSPPPLAGWLAPFDAAAADDDDDDGVFACILTCIMHWPLHHGLSQRPATFPTCLPTYLPTYTPSLAIVPPLRRGVGERRGNPCAPCMPPLFILCAWRVLSLALPPSLPPPPWALGSRSRDVSLFRLPACPAVPAASKQASNSSSLLLLRGTQGMRCIAGGPAIAVGVPMCAFTERAGGR